MLREPNPRIIPIPPPQNATGRLLSVQRVLRRTRCTDLLRRIWLWKPWFPGKVPPCDELPFADDRLNYPALYIHPVVWRRTPNSQNFCKRAAASLAGFCIVESARTSGLSAWPFDRNRFPRYGVLLVFQEPGPGSAIGVRNFYTQRVVCRPILRSSTVCQARNRFNPDVLFRLIRLR